MTERDLFLRNEIKANSGLNEEEYSGRKDLYRFLHSQDRRRLVGNNKTQTNVLQFSSGNETMDYGDLFGW